MKYAVIKRKTISHSGDERSRTNPGHGYLAYDETVTEFLPMESEQALKNWIKSNPTISSTIIEYQELTVSVETKIDFKRPVASRAS